MDQCSVKNCVYYVQNLNCVSLLHMFMYIWWQTNIFCDNSDLSYGLTVQCMHKLSRQYRDFRF